MINDFKYAFNLTMVWVKCLFLGYLTTVKFIRRQKKHSKNLVKRLNVRINLLIIESYTRKQFNILSKTLNFFLTHPASGIFFRQVWLVTYKNMPNVFSLIWLHENSNTDSLDFWKMFKKPYSISIIYLKKIVHLKLL